MNLTSACIATLINFCSDGCQKVKAAAAALQQIGLWMGAVAKKKCLTTDRCMHRGCVMLLRN